MFTGEFGAELACVSIQKNWRMFKAKHAYTQLKFLMKKATIIQTWFRLHLMAKATKAKILELNSQSLQIWWEMMEQFKKWWTQIKKKKRIEIHINSYSISELKRMSMEKFL